MVRALAQAATNSFFTLTTWCLVAAIGMTYPSETHCRSGVFACVACPMFVSAMLTPVIGT